jgi:hypothetical protein
MDGCVMSLLGEKKKGGNALGFMLGFPFGALGLWTLAG